MQDGSQPERAAASADAESPADTLQSPTFKRPLTPPGSRNVQTMDRGFTLKQGRLTEHDDGTPKRMRLERERMEESRRTSPGFCFRVGPSTSSSDMGMSPTAAAAGSPALPAEPAATPDAPPAELAGTPVVPPALSASRGRWSRASLQEGSVPARAMSHCRDRGVMLALHLESSTVS